MDKWQERYQAKVQKRIARNAARLACCEVHDFDWQDAARRAKARKKAREDRYGVILGVREIVWCRCKNCGGKISIDYAVPYMMGAHAAYRATTQKWSLQQGPRPP